jgi:hypothetical protein
MLELALSIEAMAPAGGAQSAAADIVFVGSKTYGTDFASVAVSLEDLLDESGAAATLLEGDFILINHGAGAGANLGAANLNISGYTDATGVDLYANDTSDANQKVQYKFMGAVPDTSFTCPETGSGANGLAGTVHAFRNVNLATPLDVTPTTATGIDTDQPNCPSIEPSTAGAVIVACAASASGLGGSFAMPAGFSAATNHFRTATSPGAPTHKPVVGTAIKFDWESGAFDPGIFTKATGGTTATGSWTGVTLALRPA